jgi:serine/threonine-protein kinase HipA
LAPAYDIVTTTVYLPQDEMALTLDGRPRWPDRKRLEALALLRCQIDRRAIAEILDRVAEAVAKAGTELKAYAMEHPEFRLIGAAMLDAWRTGLTQSLGMGRP